MNTSVRLTSVDVLRGLAVAAMLLVNNAGDWNHVYAPLEHAAWDGFTPTDLIFPLFLFIVGASISLSLGARREAGTPAAVLAGPMFRRGLRILLLGLALHALPWLLRDDAVLRWMGVLQRIALCFIGVGAVALWLDSLRAQWTLLAALLLGYGLLLALGGPLDKAGNIASRLDGWLLGAHAYEWNAATGQGHEPEGLLSTLGALASCLLGLIAGRALRHGQASSLAGWGLVALLLGGALDALQPINKQLWTPAYVLWSGGLSLLALWAVHQLVDLRGWPALGRSFGVNAIAAYAGAWVMAVLLEHFGWQQRLVQGPLAPIGQWLGPEAQSLAFALGFVLVWAVVVRVLDRRRIYIKV
ncbi:heparan-alpha-glucosaminide N-acetyltransferase domain-containing protein [Pelomonas sp. CA6]|uniref:acyltransferase family protein n=1 Tax=Pelomonas sp. CA6 TaxID=2907999 RepID=UPI001F4BB174|nr:heparan-alpha-glucosaminide N-acetyltransferase domain-containing protein [Pelomonas sp. CA6]MCH7342980.1 heparan-alpha-glucosaminide N-acetyltransferase domain-containing protein [Pelomonas sp. CA6]